MAIQMLATADIGSNTVHLLIARTDGRVVTRIANRTHWLGLGEEVATTGEIGPPKLKELVTALSAFRKLVEAEGISDFYVFATEAVRRAANHNDILTTIREKSGIEVQTIAAEREAELAIRGAMLDSSGELPTTFFDVGGGSAQIARLEESGVTHFNSLSIGTGTLRANAGLEDPPSRAALAKLRDIVSNALAPVSQHPPTVRLVGGGGVARGVVRALHPDRVRTVERYEVDYLKETLERSSAKIAAKRFGLSPTRSRTLLPGITVISQLLSILGLTSLLVSDHGIREGAILAMAQGELGRES